MMQVTMVYPNEQFCDQLLGSAIEKWAEECFKAGIEAYQEINILKEDV